MVILTFPHRSIIFSEIMEEKRFADIKFADIRIFKALYKSASHTPTTKIKAARNNMPLEVPSQGWPIPQHSFGCSITKVVYYINFKSTTMQKPKCNSSPLKQTIRKFTVYAGFFCLSFFNSFILSFFEKAIKS